MTRFAVFTTLPRRLCLLFLLTCGADRAMAALGEFSPNEKDAHTLHLWHLDESAPPFADRADSGLPLAGLLNGARAGQVALPGLGNSISFHASAGGTAGNSDYAGAILAAMPVLATSAADNVPASFRYFGSKGAFTYEAVVKLDVLPRDVKTGALGLLSMEDDWGGRIFNFRIENEGFLSFFPLPHGAAMGGGVATIPTTGPHAVDTEHWFHVAVTYDGNGGAANNLKLYWTRLGTGFFAANRIGSGTLSSNFNGKTGDFAIGNEARSFEKNAEAEPFPGMIDEVRISAVARHPSDYFFVPPERRVGPEQSTHAAPLSKLDLALFGVFVDSQRVSFSPGAEGLLELKSGPHRLDFDFGFKHELPGGQVKLRCFLEGAEERWREIEQGMTLVCQALSADGQVISQSRFQAVGRSAGWETSLEQSAMTRRTEPVFIPHGTRRLKIAISSGAPATTGFFAIDNVKLRVRGMDTEPLLHSGGYAYDATTTSPGGYLPGWKRGGSEPAIARLAIRADHPALGLVDGDQFRDGEWSFVQDLPPGIQQGGAFVLSWDEVFNVFDGDTRRATYTNIPPGKYTFRAIGLATDGGGTAADLALPVLIHPPFWEQLWFWPVLAAAGVALVAAVIFILNRQRSKRSLERLRFQNALERDRARIARDMHDDLGSRVTFINMSATLAQRDIERAPENARRHLLAMTGSTRDLIVAMEDLVWAVDPAHDTLDHLATHLAGMAEETFRDTAVRCRLDIPALLPALPLGAEVRNHIAMAVKESFHNVLRHAAPCEVFFSFTFNGEEIRITIRDTGAGFDSAGVERGHGLDNLASRFKEIGGTCEITSSPGAGTCIVLNCRVHHSKP